MLRRAAYGHLNIHGVPDYVVSTWEGRIRSHSPACGLTVVAIFTECDRGSQIAFGDLIDELRRAQVRRVVVPDLRHFSDHPLLQALMLGRLHRHTGATVHIVGDTGPEPEARTP